MALPLRCGAAAALAVGVSFGLGGSATAHPGPTDASGIHQCTAADATANLCTPAESSHRHTPEGNMVLVTPPGGTAAVVTVTTAAPGTVAVPTTAVAGVVAVPQAMARTGSTSSLFAIIGIAIAALGGMALWSERLVPTPVVFELSRPRAG